MSLVSVASVTSVTPELRAALRGKRLGALDYGQKRIGFAVCDELHILASPRGFFDNVPTLPGALREAFAKERLGALVVGMPVRHDDEETPIMREITVFAGNLHLWSGLPVYVADEAYSSREAQRIMRESGKKKHDRSRKGSADEVAAAVILRDFLRELE